jgi:hypothetical protein
MSVTIGQGADALLLVAVHLEGTGGGGPTVNSVVWNGTNLTRLDGIDNDGWGVVEFWYLKNPTPATGNLVTTLSAGDSFRHVARWFTGVDQTNTFRTTQKSTANSSAASSSLTVPSVVAGDYVVDALTVDATGHALTVGANQTENYDDPVGSACDTGGSNQAGADGGVMSWTWTTSAEFAHIATALIPAGAGAPDVESSAAYNSGTTAATSHAVPLPSTITADSLLMIVGRIAAAGTVSLPAGWTVVQDSSDASDDVTFYAYKDDLAVGNEDGTTVTVNHGNGKMSAVSLSITGAEDPAVLAPEASTVAVGSSTTPDPTACTPSGGSKPYLWLWAGGWEGEQTSPPSTPPSGYTAVAGANSGTGGAVTTNTRTYVAKRQNEAASEDPGSVTISVSDDWTAWTLAISPPGTGQDITATQAVETDTATAVGRRKSKALALASETDTGTAVGRKKAEPAVQASETNTAFAVGKRKSVLVGQAVETDTAGQVHVPAAQNVDVGQAVETDTATAITRRKAEPVAQAQETDTATAAARRKAEAVAVALEADTGTVVGRRKQKALAQAAEADTATALARAKRRTVIQTTEADTGTAVARRKGKAVVLASEVETAQPVTRRKARLTVQALESDSALAVGTTGNKNITVTQALEADTGRPITRAKAKTITIVTTAETASAITRRKARAVVQAGDISSSFSVATRKHKLVSEAQSTDLGFALTGAKRKALVIAVETDTAGEVVVQGTSVPTGLLNIRSRTVVRGASSSIRATGPAATMREV